MDDEHLFLLSVVDSLGKGFLTDELPAFQLAGCCMDKEVVILGSKVAMTSTHHLARGARVWLQKVASKPRRASTTRRRSTPERPADTWPRVTHDWVGWGAPHGTSQDGRISPAAGGASVGVGIHRASRCR